MDAFHRMHSRRDMERASQRKALSLSPTIVQKDMVAPVAIDHSNVLVIPDRGWSLLPIPKVASTELKRLAVIAAGRKPLSTLAIGETRPALAIHRADVHQLPSLLQLPAAEKKRFLKDPQALRLAVTRHPGERLFSFWHDKLHVCDPSYAPLNTSIQAASGLPIEEACSFEKFILFLENNWSKLQNDGHLCPQCQWLGNDQWFSHRLDRDQLIEKLPGLLKPYLDEDRLGCIHRELDLYGQNFRQSFTDRWQEAYTKKGFASLERLYGSDLEIYNYSLPQQRGSKVQSRDDFGADALVNPLQQLRDRHQQIAGLQAQLFELQQQLLKAQHALQQPPLPSIEPPQAQWPPHNTLEAGLAHLYEALGAGSSQEVLDQESAIHGHPHAGEMAYLVGLAYDQVGKHDLALNAYEHAQSLGFLTPYVLFNGGNACRSLGRSDEAIRLYHEALLLFPDFAEAHHNLSHAYCDVGDLNAAERQLRLLLRDQPECYAAAFSLGNLLRDRKCCSEAIEAYRLCLEYAPAYPDAWNNLGLLYSGLKQFKSALACYHHALSIDSCFKPARQNLAQGLVQEKRHVDALEQFELFCNLSTLTPSEKVIGLQGRVACLMELDRYDDAIILIDSLTNDRRLQLISRLHILPVLYRDDEQVSSVRRRWSDDAHELYQLLEGLDQHDSAWPELYAHAWALSNFYLAYQMEDDKPLQELYAGILDRILRPRLEKFMQPLPHRDLSDQSPLRLGVISPHLNNHNGAIWALGWFEAMAGKSDYEIFSYNIADNEDFGTQRFAALGTYRHLQLKADTAESMLQRILDDKLDFLLFTDIGMHPASKVTSVLQLAPVQAQGWGHPITSGSRTMHYFFSGEGMEPPGNDDHYSETLYRLPKTGLNYELPLAVHDGQSLFEAFDLPRDRPILNSLQSTFKYLPRNDWTFAEIAARYPKAFIVLVGHMGSGGIADRLFERMRPHFKQRGLKIENHLRILPRLDYGDYMGLFSISHHTIDTIDWNGGNSSMQSLSLDCPVVTLPSAFMRGRHTVSMLDVLELPDLIAKNTDDYINISVRLLSDGGFYNDIKHKISARKNRLFSDKSVSLAFQKAVETLCFRDPLAGDKLTSKINRLSSDQHAA